MIRTCAVIVSLTSLQLSQQDLKRYLNRQERNQNFSCLLWVSMHLWIGGLHSCTVQRSALLGDHEAFRLQRTRKPSRTKQSANAMPMNTAFKMCEFVCIPHIMASKNVPTHRQMDRQTQSAYVGPTAANLLVFSQDALKHFVGRVTNLAGGNERATP